MVSALSEKPHKTMHYCQTVGYFVHLFWLRCEANYSKGRSHGMDGAFFLRRFGC